MKHYNIVAKLTRKESDYIKDFCSQIGISHSVFAKQAMLMAVSQSYKKAEYLQEQLNGKDESFIGGESDGTYNTSDRNTAGDNGTGLQREENPSSSSLANEEATTDTNPG